MSHNTRQQIRMILKENNVDFSVKFVKQSIKKIDDSTQLKFVCTFTKGDISHTFNYSKGIGHCRGYHQNRNNWEHYAMLQEINTGKSDLGTVKKPDAAEVLYCLLFDADAINYDFDDWCSCFGYDNDSIKALKMFNDCKENGIKLNDIFSTEAIAQLSKIMEDF